MARPDPLRLDRSTRERLDRIGQEFLADILTRETVRRPENLVALSELAHVLTRIGRFEDGLEVDRRLVRAEPENPTAHYNLACSLALVGRGDQALDALEAAVNAGYDDAAYLVADEDLASLREEPRFEALLRRLRGEVPGGNA